MLTAQALRIGVHCAQASAYSYTEFQP